MRNHLGRRRTLLVLPVSLLFACSSDATARRPTPAPSTTATATGPVTESTDAGRIEVLAQSVCEVRTAGEVPAKQRLYLASSVEDAREKRPLVQGRYESATFSLRPGNAEETFSSVEASGWGTSFSGLLPTKDVPIWIKPSRKLASGMVTPGPETKAKLVRVERGSVVVRVELASSPVEETIACDDLVANPPEMVSLAPGKEMALDASKGVEVLPTPTSPAGSGLIVRSPEASVPSFFDIVELERQGKLAKVQIPSRDGTMTGWVPAANVRTIAESASKGPRVGAWTGNRMTEPAKEPNPFAPKWTACPHPVRFAAIPFKEAEPIWAGEARAQTLIGLVDEASVNKLWKDTPAPAGWIHVALKGIDSTRLLVREADLNGCKEKAG